MTVKKLGGKVFVDIRAYYKKNDGKMAPTKKGIFLDVETWKMLKSKIDQVDEAIGEIE